MKKLLAILACALLLASAVPAPADEAADPVVCIRVENAGDIYVELYPSVAPVTVENFLSLVDSGFYDGLTFHRVISGFMVQGGDPKGNGTGGSDRTIKGEFAANGVPNDLKHARGVISMARSQDMDSASSQFFIMHADASHLDGNYAAFGRVIAGMGVVDRLCITTAVADGNGTVVPGHAPVIESARRADRSEAALAQQREEANGKGGSAFTDPVSGLSFTVPEGYSLTQCANGNAVFSPDGGSEGYIAMMALDYYTYVAGISNPDSASLGFARADMGTAFFSKESFMNVLSVTDESLLSEVEIGGRAVYRAEAPQGETPAVAFAGAESGVIYVLQGPASAEAALTALLETISVP